MFDKTHSYQDLKNRVTISKPRRGGIFLRCINILVRHDAHLVLYLMTVNGLCTHTSRKPRKMTQLLDDDSTMVTGKVDE